MATSCSARPTPTVLGTRIALVVCLAVGCGSSAAAQARAPLQGCWRTDRPLGPAGGNAPVERDSLFRTLVLQDSGHVALPLIPPRQQSMWDRRSYWAAHRDSVTVRISTGLQGWHAVLMRTASGDAMRGTATYLSDVVAAGWVPPRVPVSFTRIACEQRWPSTSSIGSPLPPWERDEVLYRVEQVDRPAALLPNAALPRGIMAARQLGIAERAPMDSADSQRGIARVVLRMVIELNGRAAASRIVVANAADSSDVQRVRNALPAMRFAPAILGGTPVHQRGTWVFELQRPELPDRVHR
ncbi:MAG: hypothetical protein V4617_01635 [Gemmatimonadota bacterium]